MKGGTKGGGRFEGYCGYCSIYGHKRADCRKLTADKAAGKVGKGEEKGKGGKGKNNWQSKGGSQWNPGKGGRKGQKGNGARTAERTPAAGSHTISMERIGRPQPRPGEEVHGEQGMDQRGMEVVSLDV